MRRRRVCQVQRSSMRMRVTRAFAPVHEDLRLVGTQAAQMKWPLLSVLCGALGADRCLGGR